MPPEKEPRQSSISLTTLLISSASAAASAVIVPLFWERGSVLATAVTPIIVALVSEALKRPAKVITTSSQRVTRRSATGAAVRTEQPAGVGARGEGPERVSHWGGDGDDPFGLRAPERRKRKFPWKLGILTGLLAAVIGAGVVTASELAAGRSVGHRNRSTSVFGGHRSTPTPTATATPKESATATGTPSPEATETATAAQTATPAVTATPSAPAATPTTAPTTQATAVPTP